MSLEIAEAIREQTRRLIGIAERVGLEDAKQELAAVASALAQLAELLARAARG
jgi:NTP pyrophosphatase (non-canonical NTP hydrolase)